MANLTQTFSPLTPALYPSFLNLSPKCETFLNPLSYIRKPMVVHHFGKGPMAEWLGSALQKLLQRFESASDLQPQKAPSTSLGFFCAQRIRPSLLESEMKGAKTASAPYGALELSGVESSPCPGIAARRAAIPQSSQVPYPDNKSSRLSFNFISFQILGCRCPSL